MLHYMPADILFCIGTNLLHLLSFAKLVSNKKDKAKKEKARSQMFSLLILQVY